MADIFSNLYLAYSTRWYQKEYNVTNLEYCINRLLNENQIIFNRIISNYGFSSLPFIHLLGVVDSYSYNDRTKLMNEIESNPKILDEIKKNIHIDSILKDLDKLNSLDKDSNEYKELYNKVIQVGEYPINKNNYSENLIQFNYFNAFLISFENNVLLFKCSVSDIFKPVRKSRSSIINWYK